MPQLADAAEVMAAIDRRPGVRYPVLVPNLQGYERAIAAGAKDIAVFTAASEAFNRRNTNAGIDEIFNKFMIPQMFAEVAQGKRTPDEAAKVYDRSFKRIFARWRARKKI